jgi:hypothetical protein
MDRVFMVITTRIFVFVNEVGKVVYVKTRSIVFDVHRIHKRDKQMFVFVRMDMSNYTVSFKILDVNGKHHVYQKKSVIQTQESLSMITDALVMNLMGLVIDR